MVWFKKKAEPATKVIDPIKERIAIGFAKRIQQVQSKWAVWMNKQAAKLSLKSQKIVFVLWAVLTFLACGYVMVNSLTGTPEQKKTSVQMKLPRLRLQQPAVESTVVSDRMYRRLQVFKYRLDSLGRTKQGKIYRDSLLKARPGLMDSITMVEKMYRQK